jgi:uncharacterized protein
MRSDDPLAVAAVEAIRAGGVQVLRRLLDDNPGLATATIDDDSGNCSRTLLHVATDWPGHYPNVAATVTALIDAGAAASAPFSGPHRETPLHWAASSDDVEALDALIDAGADLEAPGAVIAGGTPLNDAVAFGQWHVARRLVERGAQTKLWHEAALGLMPRVKERFAGEPKPDPDEVTNAFWCACHGGQREPAEYLLEHGADPNWIGYEQLTPLDAAGRSGATKLVEWLRSRGAKSTDQLR